MMKSQKLLVLLLLFTPMLVWGQYSNDYSLALTVYANIQQKNREMDFLNLTNGQILNKQNAAQSIQFGHISPALSIFHPNKHFSEIELAFLRFEKEDFVQVTELSGPFPGTTQSFSLGLRYAFNFKLRTGRKSILQPHFGLSVLPYMHTFKTSPEIKALYATTQTDMGVLGQFISRLIIRLSDYAYLDFNAPVSILDARQQSMRLRNGGHNLPDIRESKTQLMLLPKRVHLRVGVGVVF